MKSLFAKCCKYVLHIFHLSHEFCLFVNVSLSFVNSVQQYTMTSCWWIPAAILARAVRNWIIAHDFHFNTYLNGNSIIFILYLWTNNLKHNAIFTMLSPKRKQQFPISIIPFSVAYYSLLKAPAVTFETTFTKNKVSETIIFWKTDLKTSQSIMPYGLNKFVCGSGGK